MSPTINWSRRRAKKREGAPRLSCGRSPINESLTMRALLWCGNPMNSRRSSRAAPS